MPVAKLTIGFMCALQSIEVTNCYPCAQFRGDGLCGRLHRGRGHAGTTRSMTRGVCRFGMAEGTMALGEVPAKYDLASVQPQIGLEARRERLLSKFETGIAACAIAEALSVMAAAMLAKGLYIHLYPMPGQAPRSWLRSFTSNSTSCRSKRSRRTWLRPRSWR